MPLCYAITLAFDIFIMSIFTALRQLIADMSYALMPLLSSYAMMPLPLEVTYATLPPRRVATRRRCRWRHDAICRLSLRCYAATPCHERVAAVTATLLFRLLLRSIYMLPAYFSLMRQRHTRQRSAGI